MRTVLAALWLTAFSWTSARAALDPPGSRLMAAPGGRFRFEAPEWRRVLQPGDDTILLLGPDERPWPAPFVAVEFYARGDRAFASADAYLRAQAKPSNVAPTSLAGKPARRWTRLERAADRGSGEFLLQSEGVVLPAADGFYALTFTAPQARFPSLRRVFQRVLDTFAPAPR